MKNTGKALLHILSTILVGTLIGGIVYLLASLLAWDINPGNWDIFGRLIFTIGIAFSYIVAYELTTPNRD